VLDAARRHVFVTAAFGTRYHRFAEGLCCSFVRWMPDARLVLFTDRPIPGLPPEVDVRVAAWHAPEHATVSSPGYAGTVAKFTLLEAAAREDGVEQVTWLDVDALVLADIRPALVTGRFNFCAHDSRTEPVPIGAGILIDPAEYAIGGIYSLPARPEVWQTLRHLIAEGRHWQDGRKRPLRLGDQTFINHLRLRFADQSRWIGGPGLEVSPAAGTWVSGDPALRAFQRASGDRVVNASGVVVPYLLSVAACWDDWLDTGFGDWDPQVAALLRSYYPSQDAALAAAARRAPLVIPIRRSWQAARRRARRAARVVLNHLSPRH
jgi:hypothetical protein